MCIGESLRGQKGKDGKMRQKVSPYQTIELDKRCLNATHDTTKFTTPPSPRSRFSRVGARFGREKKREKGSSGISGTGKSKTFDLVSPKKACMSEGGRSVAVCREIVVLGKKRAGSNPFSSTSGLRGSL